MPQLCTCTHYHPVVHILVHLASRTRFDEDEDNTWLDPDRSGPPDSAMNDLYDFRDDVTEAEQALKTARLEHAAWGYENALDGSQVAQMLVGSGLTVY